MKGAVQEERFSLVEKGTVGHARGVKRVVTVSNSAGQCPFSWSVTFDCKQCNKRFLQDAL